MGRKFRGSRTQASESPFPVASLRMCLIPLAVNCKNVKYCHLGKFIRGLVPRDFFWRLVTWASSAWHVSKFQTSRKKAGSQHKLYCLHKQSSYKGHPFHFYEQRELFSRQVPRYQLSARLSGRPVIQTAISGLPCQLIPTDALSFYCRKKALLFYQQKQLYT